MGTQLAALRELGSVTALLCQAAEDIAAVHRRPVSLRRSEITSSESVIRGARLSALLDGATPDLAAAPTGILGRSISAYALLAPGRIEDSARTIRRAPNQVLARLAVLAGGDGRPINPAAARRLAALATLISTTLDSDAALLAQVVHLEIAGRELFGEHSGLVARVASRVVAVAGGFDPRGLAVPETTLHRSLATYQEILRDWGSSGQQSAAGLEFLLGAWIHGAAEAEAIAAAA